MFLDLHKDINPQTMAVRYNHLLFLFLAITANQVIQVQSEDNGFIFNGFKSNSSSSNLTLGGASIVTPNGALKLTNTSNSITGSAFYSSPFGLSSFSTNFVFQIVPQPSKQGGHGFVFLLAPSSRLQRAIPGPYLGALTRKNDGNASNHMFLVEFNTVTNNGDHLAIHVNSLMVKSEMAKPASYYISNTNQTKPMKLEGTESPIQAWIDYDAALEIVNVTIAPSSVKKPEQPLMSMNLNLSSVLERVSYVGFSSATGTKLASSHYILGWSFRLNGLAWPLDLSLLPHPQQEKDDSNSKKVMRGIGIGTGTSVAAILLVAVVGGGLLYLYKQKQKLKDDLEEWEVECAHRYRYKDLYLSTKGFKNSEVIGFGGFGCVYRGVLPKTKETVAIKKILHNSRQGIREFVAEIASLGRMRHKHLVHLHGWCKHGDDLLLVYEFMPNGSLDAHIFSSGNGKGKCVLNWRQRYRILKGVASALVYLHSEWEQVVVHRDVKANNVLLDGKMEARLGDFGLSRLYDHGKHPSTTHIVGTLGYMAPELSHTGRATTQCDVYSYGALLLEVACGKRPIELDPVGGGNVMLLDWVREGWLRGCICQAADPRLGGDYDRDEMERVLYLGLLCCQKRADARPDMRQLTRYLDGTEAVGRVGNLEFAYSDSDTLSSSNISSMGHGVISSGSFRVGGR